MWRLAHLKMMLCSLCMDLHTGLSSAKTHGLSNPNVRSTTTSEVASTIAQGVVRTERALDTRWHTPPYVFSVLPRAAFLPQPHPNSARPSHLMTLLLTAPKINPLRPHTLHVSARTSLPITSPSPPPPCSFPIASRPCPSHSPSSAHPTSPHLITSTHVHHPFQVHSFVHHLAIMLSITITIPISIIITNAFSFTALVVSLGASSDAHHSVIVSHATCDREHCDL